MASHQKEITHGRFLSNRNPEAIWGWESKAGRLRAIRRARMISSAARLGPGKSVLEIGCGTGLFTELFAGSGADIVALDISEELIKQAKQRQLPENRVRFFNRPFEDCLFEEKFDAVIGSSVLHHLDSRKTVFKNMFNMLKPGAYMCFAEPNMLNPQIFLQKKLPWLKRKMGDSPDETAFVRFSLKPVLAAAGFRNVVIIPFDWLHPLTPASMIKRVDGIGRVFEKLPVIKEFSGSLFIYSQKPDQV